MKHVTVCHNVIISRPLQDLTKGKKPFPNPWIEGSDYDISFHRMKAAMLDGSRNLYNKDPTQRLFIEVDASDAGWGACAYQMVEPWKGAPEDEGPQIPSRGFADHLVSTPYPCY